MSDLPFPDLVGSPLDRRLVALYEMIRRLRHWQGDVDFAAVRGAALDALPPDEAEPWRALWDDVRATLTRAVAAGDGGR